ncbi:MAG: OmpH family outer membrane protein [Verrucomicrobiota bacterium]
MKKLLTITSISLVALIASAFTAGAQTKIATVDMNKIFSAYYKTKDAETRINEARNSAKKELDDRMDTYKKNLETINKLNDEMNKPELSKEAKDEKAKARDEKIAETKNLEREITEFKASREKQLQEQAVRMRNGIVDEITKLVQEKVKSENYDLVLDKSGSSLNGVPILIFARESLDFSDEIITQLNKNRSTDSAAPAAADKSPAKKK